MADFKPQSVGTSVPSLCSSDLLGRRLDGLP
jgi:hypothetical protein